MDTGGFGIPIIMRQMNGGLFNHSVHLSSVMALYNPAGPIGPPLVRMEDGRSVEEEASGPGCHSHGASHGG
jgi:hypothetical protein